MLLNAFVDDSGSEEPGRELVLAGYFGTTHVWKRSSAAWRAVLREAPSIAFFHASEAESRKGEFASWTVEERDRKVMKLTRVIDGHSFRSFEVHTSRDSFERILKPYCHFDFRSPYLYLFNAVMGTVLQQMIYLNVTLPIEFIFDKQGKDGEEAALMYGMSRSVQPPEWKRLMAGPPIFRDDDDCPPLQAADALAWHVRRSREPRGRHERREVLNLLRTDKHVESWVSDARLEHIAARFKGIVEEGDRMRRGASTVQDRKQIAAALEGLPAEDQDRAHDYLGRALEARAKGLIPSSSIDNCARLRETVPLEA